MFVFVGNFRVLFSLNLSISLRLASRTCLEICRHHGLIVYVQAWNTTQNVLYIILLCLMTTWHLSSEIGNLEIKFSSTLERLYDFRSIKLSKSREVAAAFRFYNCRKVYYITCSKKKLFLIYSKKVTYQHSKYHKLHLLPI